MMMMLGCADCASDSFWFWTCPGPDCGHTNIIKGYEYNTKHTCEVRSCDNTRSLRNLPLKKIGLGQRIYMVCKCRDCAADKTYTGQWRCKICRHDNYVEDYIPQPGADLACGVCTVLVDDTSLMIRNGLFRFNTIVGDRPQCNCQAAACVAARPTEGFWLCECHNRTQV